MSRTLAYALLALGLSSQAIAAATVYVATDGSDAATAKCPADRIGTESCPAKSVGKGVALAAANGGGEVRVAAGVYDGYFDLRDGVTVVGGYDAKFSRMRPISTEEFGSAETSAEKYPQSTRLLATAADRVMLAKGLKTRAGLRNLLLFGPDATARWAIASYVIVAEGGGPLVLQDVKLIGGRGKAGAPGGRGEAGSGWCSSGGQGGKSVEAERQTGSWWNRRTWRCDSEDGGPGASVAGPKAGGEGGKAGTSYCEVSSGVRPIVGPPGEAGKPGGSGQVGSAGAANADRFGAFVPDNHGIRWWQALPYDGKGGAGLAGDGGGGGGAGGALLSSWTENYADYDWMYCSTEVLLGGTGGTGGRGGCGGAGGSGGGSGGASIVLALTNVRVEANNLYIVQGKGGDGGGGGDGGAGGVGEEGRGITRSGTYRTCRNKTHSGGPAAAGGPGGTGGAGGGGAGGNGGPSIAIAKFGEVKMQKLGAFEVSGGAGGLGGDGGKVAGKLHGTHGLAGAVQLEHRYGGTP